MQRLKKIFGVCRFLVMVLFCWPMPHVGWAAISFGSVGTQGTGSTSINVPFPASIVSGDLLLLCIANKYPTNGPSVPSGWTQLTNGQGSGGAGAPGEDSGDVYETVMYKVATGSESGSQNVSIPSGDSSGGVMMRYSNSTGAWELSATNGGDTSSGTSWSVTGSSDPGVTSGDMMVVCSGGTNWNPNTSSEAISQTGVTFGTMAERFDNGTSTGGNVRNVVADWPVTSGASSGVPTYTSSQNVSTAGASVFVRLRESTHVCVNSLNLLGAGSC